MKARIVFLFLFLTLHFTLSAQTRNYGPWQTVKCYSGLDYTVRMTGYNEFAKKWSWDIKLRNRYNTEIHFNCFVLEGTAQSTSGRYGAGGMSLKPGEEAYNWFLVADEHNVAIFIEKFRFGADADGYASCGSMTNDIVSHNKKSKSGSSAPSHETNSDSQINVDENSNNRSLEEQQAKDEAEEARKELARQQDLARQQEIADREELQRQQELARQQEIERQQAENARRLQEQTNQYLQQAQDPNNTAITQAMYRGQAKINTTWQQSQGAITAEQAAQQQNAIQQLEAQQTQQNIQNATMGVLNLINAFSTNRQNKLERLEQERRDREESERRRAMQEALKTPEQREYERKQAEQRKVEEAQRAAEAKRLAEERRLKFLEEIAFNIQFQYGLGFDNLPILVNDPDKEDTGVTSTQQPVLHLGLQANLLDNRGISFHLNPVFTYGQNILTRGDGNHASAGLNAMIHFAPHRESVVKMFVAGAFLKRKGEFTAATGASHSGPAGMITEFYNGRYNYNLLRYGLGLLLDANGLYRRTYFKPGIFLERPSFFSPVNKSTMVGNLEVLITNKVTLDFSYSNNYFVAGHSDYPGNLKRANKDFYSLHIFLKTPLIK